MTIARVTKTVALNWRSGSDSRLTADQPFCSIKLMNGSFTRRASVRVVCVSARLGQGTTRIEFVWLGPF